MFLTRKQFPTAPAVLLMLCGVLATALRADDANSQPVEKPKPVSFYRQVRPILQRHCAGCHQPAKAGGKLLLTTYEDFQKGGEGGPCFEAGKPDESLIITYVSGEKPLMPLNADPLSPQQVELLTRWIAEGAKDDTPEAAQDKVTAENPPVYESPPVITSLAYSPDGQLLAVSGFHEILLHRADGSGLVGRLVGRAPRIESICFSPDGKLLAAVGGAPSLFGEVQIWDVETKKLAQALSIGFDTLFGASFSDDGKLLAFGAADNRARVVQVADGKQTMRFDAHSDWVLGTTFSKKLDHLITVSRDMSMKLVIVENAQLVDNITSITPGALKGGLMAVERHPKREQVLTGGADGEPKLYKIFRTRKRIIGDDFNHIRSYPALPGRIFDLAFNADGSMFVAGSSTSIGGAARIYRTGEYDEKTINNDGGLEAVNRRIAQRSKENALVHELKGIDSPVFAVAFRPDGKQVAVGGFDGRVRLYDVESGQLAGEFVPVSIVQTATTASRN
jgi:WD40 repeat protein